MAIPQNGNGTSLDLHVAEKAYARGEYQLAGHTATQLLARNPNDVEALLLMSKILIEAAAVRDCTKTTRCKNT